MRLIRRRPASTPPVPAPSSQRQCLPSKVDDCCAFTVELKILHPVGVDVGLFAGGIFELHKLHIALPSIRAPNLSIDFDVRVRFTATTFDETVISDVAPGPAPAPGRGRPHRGSVEPRGVVARGTGVRRGPARTRAARRTCRGSARRGRGLRERARSSWPVARATSHPCTTSSSIATTAFSSPVISTPPADTRPCQADGSRQARARSSIRSGMTCRQSSGRPSAGGGGAFGALAVKTRANWWMWARRSSSRQSVQGVAQSSWSSRTPATSRARSSAAGRGRTCGPPACRCFR